MPAARFPRLDARRLREVGVDPFVMPFNRVKNIRLQHFTRWVNGRIYTVCPDFENYANWAKHRQEYFASQASLFAA